MATKLYEVECQFIVLGTCFIESKDENQAKEIAQRGRHANGPRDIDLEKNTAEVSAVISVKESEE